MDSIDKKAAIKNVLIRYLDEHRHRKTPERFVILDKIYDIEGHFDIEYLYTKIREDGHTLSRATIYNSIEVFINCGLVQKHQFNTKQPLYEKSYFGKQHDHIIFTDTGEIKEFCDPRIQQIKNTVEDIFDIKIENHSLYFYGVKKNT